MKILGTINSRSQKIYKNILISILVKGGSVAVGLILVPLTIDYVDSLHYGIWLTISSFIGWMSFFDVGMTNGLRNRLSHSLAIGETEKGKIYVSTTYATLAVISVVTYILFWLVNPFINWEVFLNLPGELKDNMQNLMLIVLGTFCIQLVAQTINSVLTAYHEPATAGLIQFLGQLGILVMIFQLKRFIPGTLSILTIIMTVVPIIVLLVASIVLYCTRFQKAAPSWRKIEMKYAKDLISLGGIFFFIQIGALILLFTNNIIITKVLGPEAVTEFNVAYRLYSSVTMIYLIIINPYWSGFTDAYAKKDFEWMRENLNKLRKIWLLLSFLVIPAIYLYSDYLFNIWIGKSVVISKSLSLMMAFYTVGHTGLVLNTYLLNGLGKLKIQLYIYSIVCILNIPLSIYLGKLYGTTGIAASSVLIFFGMGIIMWIQNTKIVSQTARGIWNS